MTVEQIEASLRGLLRGQFSSLTIGFNDDHAANYVTAEGWRDEYGFYAADDRDVINWASEDERQKAIFQNTVWTLQWYPETPVVFHCIGASSLSALIAAAAVLNRPQGPEGDE